MGEDIGYEEEPWESTGNSSPEETHFFVTLIMSGGDKESDDYIPKGSKKRDKTERSESDTSSEGTPKGKGTKWLSRRRKKQRKQLKSKTRTSVDSESYVDRSNDIVNMAVPLGELHPQRSGSLTGLFREKMWLFTKRHLGTVCYCLEGENHQHAWITKNNQKMKITTRVNPKSVALGRVKKTLTRGEKNSGRTNVPGNALAASTGRGNHVPRVRVTSRLKTLPYLRRLGR